MRLSSAGFRQGQGIASLRREFLADLGTPPEEIGAHRSTVFGPPHAEADLVLVAELPMKGRLLAAWPQLEGRVMTVRGFIQGHSPQDERLSEPEARIEFAGLHSNIVEFEGDSPVRKLALYGELERLSEQVAGRLLAVERAQA